MTAAPAVISGSRRAVRLVLGATAAVVAALVLVGLLVAVLAGRSAGAGTALGLGRSPGDRRARPGVPRC